MLSYTDSSVIDRCINLATVTFVIIYRIYLFLNRPGKESRAIQITGIECVGQCNNQCEYIAVKENVLLNYTVTLSSFSISSLYLPLSV